MHILRGYAVCFNDVEELCGEDTLFRPDAFMQSVRWPVGLRFGSHHARDLASTSNGTLSLFQDNYGLGFEAHLPNSPAAARIVQAVASQRVQGCSGLFQYAKTHRIGSSGANSVLSVQASRVDHIAIVAAPVFRNTAVWSSDVPSSDLPVRLREVAAQWHRGNAVATAYEGILVRCCPTTPPARKAPAALAKPPAPISLVPARPAPPQKPVASPELSVRVYQTGLDQEHGGQWHYSQGRSPVIYTRFGGYL